MTEDLIKGISRTFHISGGNKNTDDKDKVEEIETALTNVRGQVFGGIC